MVLEHVDGFTTSAVRNAGIEGYVKCDGVCRVMFRFDSGFVFVLFVTTCAMVL